MQKPLVISLAFSFLLYITSVHGVMAITENAENLSSGNQSTIVGNVLNSTGMNLSDYSKDNISGHMSQGKATVCSLGGPCQ